MVDFKKAFDSVTWSFIEKSLRKFKFEKDITRWVLTLILSGLMWKEVHCLLIYLLFVQKC